MMLLLSCGQTANEAQKPSLNKADQVKNKQLEPQNEKSKDSELELAFDPSKLDTLIRLQDDVSVRLKYSEPVSISEYFIDSFALDSLIEPFDNRHLEALEIEKYQLKKFRNQVKRDSAGLHLKMNDGTWSLLKLDPKKDEAGYSFEYYFKELGFYSIRLQWSEGNAYKLVNQKTGEVTNIYGRPYFSPNGKLLISISADIDAGYSPNGFQLFSNQKGEIKLLGHFNPVDWGPESVRWENNQRLWLRSHYFGIKEGNYEYMNFYSQLVFKNGN